MKRVVFIAFLFAFVHTVGAQGLSRPHGIGLRVGFWNMADQTLRFSFSGAEARGQVDLSGIGTWVSFFSRLHPNWFMQLEFGTIANVHSEIVNNPNATSDVSVVFPLLLGVRYAMLSGRSTSALQPYLAAGGGPYWMTDFRVSDDFQEQNIVGESRVKYGAYAGAGVLLTVTSWAALQFDTKYHCIDFKTNSAYSGPEFGLGFCIMWGKSREIIRIKDTKLIVQDLYPAYYPFYNTYPLALVTVQNVAGYAIEVNVRSSIKGYSKRPKDSGFIRLERNETRDIPVTVLFGEQLMQASRREPAVLDLTVEARAGTIYRKEIRTSIMIHHRNAWDGDMNKLRFYVTPEDKEVMAMVHENLAAGSGNLDEADNVRIGRALFTGLQKRALSYQKDPNVPFYQDDRVLYPVETLAAGGGDCDDLVVLYASLLESAGIHTAFVQVRDPKKDIAHLYLIFDSGVGPEQGERVSSNDKRYLLRAQRSGAVHIWIPVETTLVTQGFENAWKTGATQYLDEAMLRNGLAEAWVQIIDVE